MSIPNGKVRMSTAARKLKRWRERRGIVQVDMASYLGVTGAMLCYMEKGQRHPGLDLAVFIEDKCRIKPREWFDV